LERRKSVLLHTRLLPAMAAAIPAPGEAGGDAELLMGAPAAERALLSLDWEPRRAAGGWWISLGVVPMKRRSPSHAAGRTLPIIEVGASASAGVGGGAVVVAVVGVVASLGEVARPVVGSADSLLPL
jgi:hypothetical protein